MQNSATLGIELMTWEANPQYNSDESDPEDVNDDKSVLPNWLMARPEMIYPPQCIETGKMLGHGQYGTVFKGKYVQGNAV